jgi:hypothetical protein
MTIKLIHALQSNDKKDVITQTHMKIDERLEQIPVQYKRVITGFDSYCLLFIQINLFPLSGVFILK